MKHPYFNWKTYPADFKELSKGAKMNVGLLTDIQKPKSNELVRMLCFNSGIRQTKELQNWTAWNGCVYVDVDYKNYMSVNNEATEPLKVISDVWNYLVKNHSSHFYYAELSRSQKGFHFIFYMDTDYPTEERRESLNYMAIAAVIKAFTECGYKDAIEYKQIKNGVETNKVLDTCTNSPYQMCYITGMGKINDKCIGDWKVNTNGLSDIIEKLKTKYHKTNVINKNHTYKSTLLKINTIQSVPYIEHLVRRNLFKSLSTIFSGDELKEQWIRCAKLIPEEHNHTIQYYINVPYSLDWNDSLTDNEYCDKDLLKLFGYEVKITTYNKHLTYDKTMKKIYDIIHNGE